MPLFYQQDINENTRLGVWLIKEDEPFFLDAVPLHREITHPHKRLQHLAGRYLLKCLFPDFPYELIRIADTRKPFLINEAYHFSISHCGDYAAAIVSRHQRVGIDVEMATPKVGRILHKFLNEKEQGLLQEMQESLKVSQQMPDMTLSANPFLMPTLLWSAKESVFKWYGKGNVDFSEHILLQQFYGMNKGHINGIFRSDFQVPFTVEFMFFGELSLSWVCNDYTG